MPRLAHASLVRTANPKRLTAPANRIRDMSVAKPLWGAPRIHGELLKLGIDVGQTTVAKSMATRRQPAGHRRRWACRTNCNLTKRAGLADFVRPDLETDQRVGAEGVGDRHVSRIAPLSDQHAADSRHVVACVECVPPPAKIGLEPAGEIHWAIGRWHFGLCIAEAQASQIRWLASTACAPNGSP